MDSQSPINDHEKILKAIAKNVRRLRKDMGYSQLELALECELDRTYIGYVENAKRNVSIKVLCQMANALGVRVEDLIEDV